MLSWPITNEILNNTDLMEFICLYYGFPPLIVGVRSWCTPVRDEEEVIQDAMSWHIDLTLIIILKCLYLQRMLITVSVITSTSTKRTIRSYPKCSCMEALGATLPDNLLKIILSTVTYHLIVVN